MTIEEAIKHAEEVAEEQREKAKEFHQAQVNKCEVFPFAEMDYTYENKCKECAEEHKQLAKWLKELREIKNIVDSAEMIIEEEYGVVIVEGYVDVFDLIKKKVRLLDE